MMRQLWTVAVIATAGAWSAPAAACECDEVTLEESLARASDVFYGRVEAFDEVEENRWQATLKLEKTYKGRARDKVTVQTAGTHKMCGVDFRPGAAYLVFATKREGALHTSSCELRADRAARQRAARA